ncbi:hypothetical protein A3C67_03345 [Candidatus Nomurabacteria bacterium RIFCSPHIGHO2_02_FULL_42_19]|uniref:Uncharacterized protein n=1 Tax=Candidatus Nomurabacteria bacterium RIFCSPHIGHO2_02_FULL_42_19 TaxID=1801756 RepID=A0A1F6W2T6_9BACT|nr:MAG: hypothetical protein A3C67_03345 [Candidatus Nomurabacteria bacterium RIFCSPHIGHO2_02_FULL_42_19]
MFSSGILGKNLFDNFGFSGFWHNIAKSVVIDVAKRFLAGPAALPKFSAISSPNIFGQIVYVIFGIRKSDGEKKLSRWRIIKNRCWKLQIGKFSSV